MPIANQIKSLTEDIEASYGARVTAVSDIIRETQAFLGSSHRTHKKMAEDLRTSLSENNADRVGEVRRMRTNNLKELKETAQSLKELAQKLAEFLSSAEDERKKEFVHLFGEIKAAVGDIEKDTAQMLSNYKSDHKEMATKLRGSLTRETKDRINQVRDLLSDFAQKHQGAATSLRSELSSFQRNLSKTVGEMRVDFASDHQQAQTHWQNLTKVMAAKRAGKSIPGARAEMGVPKAAKVEAEEAFEGGELKARALAVIQAHPGGITLPEVGKALKVAYIRVAKPLKELLVEMRVTKRDSEYFPS